MNNVVNIKVHQHFSPPSSSLFLFSFSFFHFFFFAFLPLRECKIVFCSFIIFLLQPFCEGVIALVSKRTGGLSRGHWEYARSS